MKFLLAKKLNMTQVFTDSGEVIPVTALQAMPEMKIADFAPGDVINVSGVSRGRGFTGPVKRHGFHGAPASHGHDHPRAVGAIGQRFPQHTRPGMRMAGRMGGGKATVKNSIVVAIDAEKNLLFVKGGVPGAPEGTVKVILTGGKKNLPKIAEYASKSL